MTDKPTLLIDSHYIGHQAHYTLGDLSHEDVATGVVFGFLSRVLSLGLQFKTNDIVFCWDSKHSYRKRKYPWYKEHRRTYKDGEEESLRILHQQLRLLRKEILPGIGFANQLFQKGCESDDLMAKVVMGKLGEWVIVTADEDLWQCLASNTRVYNPSQKKMMTHRRLRDEHGISPREWAMAKAIAGCPSDSVPGVPGVGMKTAIKYLRGELPETYKTYKAIVSEKDIYTRNRQLVFLPISKTREPDIVANHFSVEGFREMCEKYGLESFLQEAMLANWEALFSGVITESSTSMYHRKGKVRAPRRRKQRAKDKTADDQGLIHGM